MGIGLQLRANIVASISNAALHFETSCKPVHVITGSKGLLPRRTPESPGRTNRGGP